MVKSTLIGKLLYSGNEFKYPVTSRESGGTAPRTHIIVRLQNTRVYGIYNPKALGCGADPGY